MAKLNNVTIPDSIANRGKYHWEPPEILGENGAGTAVVAPYAEVTWKFPYMTASDYAWWVTTLLGGAASLACESNTQLVNHLQAATNCTCIVYRPSYESIQNGLYMNVEVRIKRIVAV